MIGGHRPHSERMDAPGAEALARARLGPAAFALLALLAAGAGTVEVRAQEPSPEAPLPNLSGRKYPPRVYRTVRLQGPPPTIDGHLGDAAWNEGVWAGDYTQQIPTEGAPPSQTTELKILYDERNVYVAIRVHDDPDKVHRYPGRRDALIGDIVGICFDSYNDSAPASSSTSPRGGARST